MKKIDFEFWVYILLFKTSRSLISFSSILEFHSAQNTFESFTQVTLYLMAAASLVLLTNTKFTISFFPQLLYLPFRNCSRFQELERKTLKSEEFQKRLHPYKVKKCVI